MVDLQLCLQEPFAEQSQESIHILEDIAGIHSVAVQGLPAEPQKLQQDRMQILILNGPLPELINLRSLMKVIEDTPELRIVRPERQLEINLDGLTEPHQEGHDIVIHIFLLVVKQVLLL